MRGEPSYPLDDLTERSLFSGNINTGGKSLKRQNSTLPIMRGQPSRPPIGKVTRVSELHNHPHILSLLPIMRRQPACPPGGQTSKTANADHPQISRNLKKKIIFVNWQWSVQTRRDLNRKGRLAANGSNLGVAGAQAAPRVH